uniref:Regulatory factor X1 n=1 Tax=Pelodiscus sinensis TaxID=13735 RepID=K7GD35_PELSI
MATQAYVTELQAAQQQSQQQQAQQQPTAAATTAAPAAAQQQYVAELQSTQQQPATQKQYVSEIQAPQPQAQASGQQTPTPAPQQYIVVTVSEGAMRPSDSVSESSPGSTATQSGVPTQVVQQVQATQQRLLVQASVQAKPPSVSPLQLTGVQVPQQIVPLQRLVVQSTAQASKGGQVSLAVHSVQQQAHSPPEHSPVQSNSSAAKPGQVQQLQVHGVQQVPVSQERSVVQATPQTPKAGTVQQLTVQGLQQVHVTQEVQQLQQVPVQHVYPSQVQYVEGGDASYTASTIRPSTYPYTEAPLYTPNTGANYYESQATPAQVTTPATSQTVASTGSVPSLPLPRPVLLRAGTAPGVGGRGLWSEGLVHFGRLLFLIFGFYKRALGQTYSQSVAHINRLLPSSVQWLLDNYETAEGVSLPRSTLYCHYLLHCQEQKLEPVNAASFGKLIRSVFMGLRTRRLGTRGNSKYHYYGLRIKANSPLLRLMEDQQHLAMRQQPFSQKQRLKPLQKMEGMTNGVAVGQQPGSGLSDISAQVQQYQQFLDASRTLSEFSELDLQGKALPDGIGAEDVKAFQLLYREHCEAIVDVMINLQFTLVETLWKTFWRYNLNQPSEATPIAVHDEAEKRLPKNCLVILSKYEPVLKWTKDCDNMLYQGLVEILIPDVLRPIPSALTQAIRNFAKSLESWLTNAMMNIPEEMVRVKVAAASAFAQTLRRYTSLNHLAQAARAVLQNTAQINQMLSDLNRVDFANVQVTRPPGRVASCPATRQRSQPRSLASRLQQQNSLEQWAVWLDGGVTQVQKPHQGSSSFPKAAKLFLLKWSFYSSMVIRDLTLRSAASFGSFHLIRLLYDEYMYYLIEHRVAQAKGETPIAVMGEFANLSSSLNSLDPDK